MFRRDFERAFLLLEWSSVVADAVGVNAEL